MSINFDYIIAGGGSAGCVLANRLSKDPDVKVLLLEAGGTDWHPFIKMPSGVSKIMAGETFDAKLYNYAYYTEGQPHLNNRKLFFPRGKGVGGSSNINGMLYIRGPPVIMISGDNLEMVAGLMKKSYLILRKVKITKTVLTYIMDLMEN